jgi:hypothetical protein
MNIMFTVDPSDLVSKIADAGEIPALIRALINADCHDEIVAELDATDVLDSLDRDEVKDWTVNNFDRADLYDDEDILDEMDHGDILNYVGRNIGDSRILDLLDDMPASTILDHLANNGEADDIKDYVQQHGLLPAGNTASNAELLAELQRRLTDGSGSMDANDVLNVLTQSGRLVIRTVYHTK